MNAEIIASLAQFGPVAVFALVVFISYDRLVRHLLPVLQKNAEAFDRLTRAIDTSDKITERLEKKIEEHDRFVREWLDRNNYG